MQERLLPLHCQHFHVPSWHWLNQSKEFGAISERKCYFQECMATNKDNFIMLFLSKNEYVVCFIFKQSNLLCCCLGECPDIAGPISSCCYPVNPREEYGMCTTKLLVKATSTLWLLYFLSSVEKFGTIDNNNATNDRFVLAMSEK